MNADVADYLLDPTSWSLPPLATKAEQRRQRRGVKFPGGETLEPWQIHTRGDNVYVALSDGSRWRCYMRGGKTFRRRLKAPCPTINLFSSIDPGAFLPLGISAETLEEAQTTAFAHAMTLLHEAMEKPHA